jgi:hypothetical protein
MSNKIERIVTMGDRYALAIMTYLGIALLMVGSTLNGENNAFAQSSTSAACTHPVLQEDGTYLDEPGCASGETCCNGTCIGDTQICCNNQPADAATCGCCTDSAGNESASCTGP